MRDEMKDEPSELLSITESEANERLDKVLASRFSDSQSRSYFQRLIEEGRVLLNGKPVKKRIKPSLGDEVEVFFSILPEISLEPEDIPLSILYEDAYLLAVNKPAGMVVHPAPGNWSGTFVNALLHHCDLEEMKPIVSLEQSLPRPGIVHRLDKDTTGVLVAAKTATAQQKLIELFSSRNVHKEYLAISAGNPGSGTIDLPIGRHPTLRQKMCVREEGRAAVTHVETLITDKGYSLLKLILETGRTHQIRVHLKHKGAPVLGDPIYGDLARNEKMRAERQLLHAHRIAFCHPITGEALEIEAPLPEDMKNQIAKLFSTDYTRLHESGCAKSKSSKSHG